MNINNEDLQEFAKLYREAFGEYISEKDALEMASDLADLYTLLAEPLPSEQSNPMLHPEGPDLPSPS